MYKRIINYVIKLVFCQSKKDLFQSLFPPVQHWGPTVDDVKTSFVDYIKEKAPT